MKQPILVFGVPRSGTSLVAQIINTWGAFTGEVRASDASNPNGYVEYAGISKITNNILGNSFYVNTDIISESDRLSMSELIQQLHRSSLESTQPWLLKYPQLSVMSRWIKTIVTEICSVPPNTVVVIRHPLSVVASQKRYAEANLLDQDLKKFPFDKALSAWQYYMYSLIQESGSETLFVSMEDILTNGPARVLNWLNTKYGSSTDLTYMKHVVDAKLVHHRNETGILTPQQEKLYDVLLQLAKGQIVVDDIHDIQQYRPNMTDLDDLSMWYQSLRSS